MSPFPVGAVLTRSEPRAAPRAVSKARGPRDPVSHEEQGFPFPGGLAGAFPHPNVSHSSLPTAWSWLSGSCKWTAVLSPVPVPVGTGPRGYRRGRWLSVRWHLALCWSLISVR